METYKYKVCKIWIKAGRRKSKKTEITLCLKNDFLFITLPWVEYQSLN